MRYAPHDYQIHGEQAIVNTEKLGLFWEMGLGPAKQ
jgi:hypothetical protein